MLSIRNLYLYARNRWFVRYCLIKIISKIRKDDHRLLYINPNDVVYTVSRNDKTLKGNSVWHFGSVSSGDWDLNGCPVREYGNVYKILRQRVENNAEYKQIPEFMKNLKVIENGGNWYNCKTKEDYMKRWQLIERLYLSIKKNGYKNRRELKSKDLLDEIRIQVGRRGELLFEEGFHRLVIAQLLNLKQIPVVIYRRHREWALLREDVKKIVLSRGFFHQPFNHPDIDILPKWYGNHLKDQAFYGNERWDYILDSLPFKKGNVLDIGAYFGYFSHRFEDLGFETFAIEINEENFAVLKRYRDIKEKKFTLWNKNIFDIDPLNYDIVLALSVFHHLVRTKENYEKLVDFLRRLQCRIMYFEPSKTSGHNPYKSFNDEEFIDFVLSNSSLNYAKLLSSTKVGRNLYMLTP